MIDVENGLSATRADPTRIAPQYDGGDHLHVNLTGYQATGNAIPVDQLRDPACS
jgi:hypothetical protein